MPVYFQFTGNALTRGGKEASNALATVAIRQL